MKKPFFRQLSANLNKQVQEFQRTAKRRKQKQEREQRQQEVVNAARDERASRDKAARLRSARRSAAQQWADLRQTLHWNTFQRALHQTGKNSKRAVQALRKARPQSEAMRHWSFRLAVAVAICSIIGNFVLYNRYSPSRTLVKIGHRTVTKREYLANLDGVAGKAVLSKIVFGELITQAAAKAGVMPSAQDIDTRLADLRRRAPGSVPAQDTATLRTDTEQMIAMENLRIKNATASDTEIAAFYGAHRNEYVLPPQTQATLVLSQNAADAGQAARLLAQDMPEEAIATHHGLHVAGVDGFQVNMNSLPPSVRNQLTGAVMQMKGGEIKTFTLDKVFLTFKIKNHENSTILPLSQVRDQVARQVKLQKAPSEQEEMVMLYKQNKPDFDMANYKGYFSELENAPTPAGTTNGQKTASLP